ncbi:MAG: hypothetical protein U9N57_01325 [Pseudomonadota bacterium]|nr:hypothetical protein [Pseudomonadota bacterium]
MNPDKIRNSEFGIEFVYPNKLDDPEIIDRAELFELPDGGYFVDIIFHVNFQYRNRLATTSKTADFKSRVFKTSTFAMSFLKKRNIQTICFFLGDASLRKIEDIQSE